MESSYIRETRDTNVARAVVSLSKMHLPRTASKLKTWFSREHNKVHRLSVNRFYFDITSTSSRTASESQNRDVRVRVRSSAPFGVGPEKPGGLDCRHLVERVARFFHRFRNRASDIGQNLSFEGVAFRRFGWTNTSDVLHHRVT